MNTENQKFIVTDFRRDTKQTWYVCARPGYMRRADGTQARDGSFKGGPEWTTKRYNALELSLSAAQRIRAKCPSATIREA